ncbi:MAG: hypothetical protein SNJ70_02490 [Armatimonadota bacterium]
MISTRARLARCLAEYPFPHRADKKDLRIIADEICSACLRLKEKYADINAVEVDNLTLQQKSFLLDARIASFDQLKGGYSRFVLYEKTGKLSLLVNEEDHLRIQSVMSGFVPDRVWREVNWADDVLSESLMFAYSKKYGYLTSSISNIGTGLRISALMHLPALALTDKLASRLRASFDLGISIRGIFGEGTRSTGYFYQVSNEITLGINEKEIIERVCSVTNYLLKEERIARREIYKNRLDEIVYNAEKSLRSLKNLISVKAERAIDFLSYVRLANEYGLLENCSRGLLNEIFTGLQAACADNPKADIDRAELMRKKTSEIVFRK